MKKTYLTPNNLLEYRKYSMTFLKPTFSHFFKKECFLIGINEQHSSIIFVNSHYIKKPSQTKGGTLQVFQEIGDINPLVEIKDIIYENSFFN